MAECRIAFRSPSHYWAERLDRPQDLVLVAAAAAITRSAVDALDAGDLDLARRLWAAVDGDALLAAWDDQVVAMKGMTPAMTGDRPMNFDGSSPAPLYRALSTRVFERDGYRCRYCDIPVVTQWKNGDVPRLVAALPELTPTLHVENGSLIRTGHAGSLGNVDRKKWLWQWASPDHVVPRSHFGPTTAENLVTSCAGCNYGKGDSTLEQLDVVDPRNAP